jgi:hypothetical protein
MFFTVMSLPCHKTKSSISNHLQTETKITSTSLMLFSQVFHHSNKKWTNPYSSSCLNFELSWPLFFIHSYIFKILTSLMVMSLKSSSSLFACTSYLHVQWPNGYFQRVSIGRKSNAMKLTYLMIKN